MNLPIVFLLLCLCALIAFFINRYKRLPKFVFLFFSVTIIVFTCFYALNRESADDTVATGSGESGYPVVIFSQVASDIYLSDGETRIALPVSVSGKRKYDCIRFVFNSDDSSITEQGFLDKVHFSLLSSDGTLLPASYLVFSKEDDVDFPKNFILKVFFIYPTFSEDAKIRCIVENFLDSKLKVAEVSIGSCLSTEEK